MRLSETILKCLNELGWELAMTDVCGNKYMAEIKCKPFKDNRAEHFRIAFDGSDEGFVSSVEKCADSFDIYEYAERLIEDYGGVPKRLTDIFDDGGLVRDKINELAEALSKQLDQPKNYAFNVMETRTVIVKAESFDEAFAHISDELNSDWKGVDRRVIEAKTSIYSKGKQVPVDNGLLPDGTDISGYEFYDCSVPAKGNVEDKKLCHLEIEFADGYGMCVRSETKNPSIDQIGRFLAETGSNYTADDVSSVLYIDPISAIMFYNMDGE